MCGYRKHYTKHCYTLKGKKKAADDQFIEILKMKYMKKVDGDKLFLLLVYKDLVSLPDQVKLSVKSQFMGVLSATQQSIYSFKHPLIFQITQLKKKNWQEI